jgi:hypothetical protein
VFAPDALAALLQSGLSGAELAALPRPAIAAGQRLVLLAHERPSHGEGAGFSSLLAAAGSGEMSARGAAALARFAASSTATGAAASAAAAAGRAAAVAHAGPRAAVMRLQLLTTGDVRRDYTAVSGALVRQRSQVVFADSPQMPAPGSAGASAVAAFAGGGEAASAAAAVAVTPSLHQLWVASRVSPLPATTAGLVTQDDVAAAAASEAAATTAITRAGAVVPFQGSGAISRWQPQMQPQEWAASRPYQSLIGHCIPRALLAPRCLSHLLCQQPQQQQWQAQQSSLARGFGGGLDGAPQPSLPPLSGVPLAVQESALVDALLHALSGVPSAYVTVSCPTLPRAPASAAAAVAAGGASSSSGGGAAGGLGGAGSTAGLLLPHAVGTPLAASLAAEGAEFVLAADAAEAPAGSSSGGSTANRSPEARGEPQQPPPWQPEPSLAFLARRLLPLAGTFVRCRAATEALSRPGEGRVRHALAAACGALLGEYEALLLQLEGAARRAPGTSFGLLAAQAGASGHPLPPSARPGYSPATAAAPAPILSLSLQQLWFYLQPASRTLAALLAVLTSVRHARGGALLTALAVHAAGVGDESSRALAELLLQRAAAPFMGMLAGWLYRGLLADEDAEFMVEATPATPAAGAAGGGSAGDSLGAVAAAGGAGSDAGSSFLASCFRLRPAMVPDFLAPHQASILAAGKYLHILRLCAERAGSGAPAGVVAGDYISGLGAGGIHPQLHRAGALLLSPSALEAGGVDRRVDGAVASARALVAFSVHGSSYSAAYAREAAAGSRRRGSGATTLSSGGSESVLSLSTSPSARGGGGGASSLAHVVIGSHLQPASPADHRRFGSGGAQGTNSLSVSPHSDAAPGEVAAAGLPSRSGSSSAAGAAAGGWSRNASRGGTSAFSSAGSSVTHAPLMRGAADDGTAGGGFGGGSPVALSARERQRYGAGALHALGDDAAAAAAAAGPLTLSVGSLHVLPFATPLKFSGTNPASYAGPIAAAAAFAARRVLELFAAVPPSRPIAGAGAFAALDRAWGRGGAEGSGFGGIAGGGGGGGFALFQRLASYKSLFLLARGDFLSAFFDVAGEELQREVAPPPAVPGAGAVPATGAASGAAAAGSGTGARAARSGAATAASAQRLRHLLELAMKASTAEGDPHRDEFTVALAPCTILAQAAALAAGQDALVAPTAGNGNGNGSGSGSYYSAGGGSGTGGGTSGPVAATPGLKGYNSVTLTASPGFPLSMVLSRAAVAKYQLLFRQLAFARYVEAAVCQCWVAQQSCRELGGLRATLASSFALRQRMLHFLQNLAYYTMVEVVEPRWRDMAVGIATAATLEDVIAVHDAFLDACLHDTLLTSPDLLKQLTKLVTLCLLFATQISSAIDSHRLPEAELDRRAGLNRAGQRARQTLEKGEYYAASVVSSASFAVGGGGGGGLRRGSAAGDGPGSDDDDDGDDARSVGSHRSARSAATARSGLSRAGSRRGSALGAASVGLAGGAAPALSAAGAQASRDRERRRARQRAQTDAMQHTMAQQGWQAMITKSSRMFDALLRDFLGALLARVRADSARHQHLLHLCGRLDYNGFYSRHLGLGQQLYGGLAPLGTGQGLGSGM